MSKSLGIFGTSIRPINQTYSTNKILVVKSTFPTKRKHKVMQSEGFKKNKTHKSCFELFILHFIFNVSAEFSWSF